MKKFSEKKRTVNLALLAVAVLGIAFGGFTAFTGHKMSRASAPALSSAPAARAEEARQYSVRTFIHIFMTRP